MQISKSGQYSGDWVLALSAQKQPVRNSEEHYLEKIGGEEDTDNVLERTARAAFNTPTTEMTSNEAVRIASRGIAADGRQARHDAVIASLKQKLADNEVDPVALGVVTAEFWGGCQDIEALEKAAKAAVAEKTKRIRMAWQDEAMKPQDRTMKFQSSHKLGRVYSAAAQGDDSAPVMQRQLPRTAASIFDPFRLDRFAEEETEHDKAVAESKADSKARREASRNWRTEAHEIPEGMAPMKGSGVIHSGAANEQIVSSYKAPRNQISISDDIAVASNATPEEIKKKLSDLFLQKIEDSADKIRKANAERAARIEDNSKARKDKDWLPREFRKDAENAPPQEGVRHAKSTSELEKRLRELWR